MTTLCIAQQRPVEVETPTVLDEGHAKLEFKVAHLKRQTYPLSGFTGDLTKLGLLRFIFSYEGYAELQLEGTLLDILRVKERKQAFYSNIASKRNPTGDVGDFTLWTKFRLLNEYKHNVSFSLRFGVQLPNASNESGLGVDQLNFYASALLQKHFHGLMILNFGLAVYDDPVLPTSQHDMVIYAYEYMVPITDQTSLLFQTNGRFGHEGIGVYRLFNTKLGIEQTFDDLALRFTGIMNAAPSDNAYGAEFGMSYTFHMFNPHENQ